MPAKIVGDKEGPLFRTAQGKTRELTAEPMHRNDVLGMIRRRRWQAGGANLLPQLRANGFTVYLQSSGGTLEEAQQMTAHELARTTKLYDRTQDQISLDEVGRIII